MRLFFILIFISSCSRLAVSLNKTEILSTKQISHNPTNYSVGKCYKKVISNSISYYRLDSTLDKRLTFFYENSNYPHIVLRKEYPFNNISKIDSEIPDLELISCKKTRNVSLSSFITNCLKQKHNKLDSIKFICKK
jgi:hypothetical protein